MGNCIRDTKYRWPGGVVPYVIDDDLDEVEVMRHIATWNSSGAGIRFASFRPESIPPGTIPKPAYVRFVPSDGGPCRSPIGRRYAGQPIYCNPARTTLVHEMGHALGLEHEHQRFDRNNHISVIEDNIVAGLRYAYERRTIDQAIPVGAYDFDSRMHYAENTFAVEFTVNREVPGLSSKHPPAVAFFRDQLHIVTVDDDRNLVHTKMDDRRRFTRPRPIDGQSSKAGVSLAVFDGRLILVHLGRTSDDVWISSTSTGSGFSRNERIPGLKNGTVPALAAFDGQLHMLWADTADSEIRHSRSDTGRADDWSRPDPIGQTSRVPVGLAATDTRLHVAHLGRTSLDLWHSTSRDGSTWTENVRIGQQSKASPTLTATEDTVHLTHLGKTSNQIWHSTLEEGDRFTDNRETNQLSRTRTAMAVGNLGSPRLRLLAHIGETSNRVYVSEYNSALRTMISIDPARTAGGFGGLQLTDGDIAAVRFMYR